MDQQELRRRVALILEAEEQLVVDWAHVGSLCLALQEDLLEVPDAEVPDALLHFVDDGDIRSKDHAYGERQRELMRRYVETGEMVEHAPSEPLTWVHIAGCLLILALPIVFIVWWLLG